MDNIEKNTHYIASVDTVNIYGRDRIVVGADGIDGWIEGVGSSITRPFKKVEYDFYFYDYCRGTTEDCGVAQWVNTTKVNRSQQGKVFPNPSYQTTQIELENHITNGQIKVTNLLGQVIFSDAFEGEQKTIEVSDWQTGLYLIQVFENGQLVFNEKLMVAE